MALNSEYKEFFVRAVQMAVGAKKDQETGFLIDYQVTDVNGNQISAKNRFLKNHFPSEQVFKKLFNSVTFKLNPEDTASQDSQGLVRVVTGHNIVNRTNIDIDVSLDNKEYTTVVVPSTLPIVSAGSNITITPQIRRAIDNVIVGSIPGGDRQLYYIDYLIAAANAPSQIDNIKNVARVLETYVYNAPVIPEDVGQDDLVYEMGETVISANSLANNDYLEIDLHWNKFSTDMSYNGIIYATFGTDDDPRLNHKCFTFNPSSFPEWAGESITVHANIKIYRIDATSVYISTRYTVFLQNFLAAVTPSPTSDSQRAGTATPQVAVSSEFWTRDRSINSSKIDWAANQTFSVIYDNAGSAPKEELNESCIYFIKSVND